MDDDYYENKFEKGLDIIFEKSKWLSFFLGVQIATFLLITVLNPLFREIKQSELFRVFIKKILIFFINFDLFDSNKIHQYILISQT